MVKLRVSPCPLLPLRITLLLGRYTPLNTTVFCENSSPDLVNPLHHNALLGNILYRLGLR